MHIRSFRVVFDLERRLHRIDRWRLPLPYGLPLRSLGYAAAALLVVLVLSGLPLIGIVLDLLPVPARLVLLPVASAVVLTRVRVDGRSAHHTALALVRFHARPRFVSMWRAATAPETEVAFADVTIAPDARGSRLRPGRVRGAASVLVGYPASLLERRHSMQVRQRGNAPLDPGVRISFDASRRLEIR